MQAVNCSNFIVFLREFFGEGCSGAVLNGVESVEKRYP